MARAPQTPSLTLPATDAERTKLQQLCASFVRGQRADGRSPKTIAMYLDAVLRLERYLVEQSMPTKLAGIRREHLEVQMIDIIEGRAPLTLAIATRACRHFPAPLPGRLVWPILWSC